MGMTLETFKQLIENLKADHDRTLELYKLGIDIISYDTGPKIINALGIEAFGEDKWSWVLWFCFENDFGQKGHTATDHGKPICYDVESLFELVEGKE